MIILPEPFDIPVIDALEETVQLNVVKGILDESWAFTSVLLQIVSSVKLIDKTGKGNTWMVCAELGPEQELIDAVAVYVTVPEVIPELIIVCAGIVVEPDNDIPVKLDGLAADHVIDAPVTLLVKLIGDDNKLEHKLWFWPEKVIVGIGSTVIVLTLDSIGQTLFKGFTVVIV